MIKQIIMKHLFDYLKLKNVPYEKRGNIIMIQCPFEDKKEFLVSLAYKTRPYEMFCSSCNKYYNVIDVAKKVENLTGDEDEILHHLKELLNIDVMTKKDEENLDKLLDFYEQKGFDLVPIAKGDKRPIEQGWTNKTHTDKTEWKTWLANGLNIGCKTGIKSNVTVIDIDQKEIPKEISKNILKETLIQETKKGWHLFFKYEPDLPKTRIDELKIDIENDGGQVVIVPSIVNGHKRTIDNEKIIQMPDDIKKLFLSKVTVPRQTKSEQIREAIETENFKIDPTKFNLKNNNLEGCCNSEFIKLGGILRKKLNTQQTGYVLNVLNQHMLEEPMKQQALNAMVRELDKYTQFDDEELAHQALEYLKDVEEATRTEIAMAIVGTNRGQDKKRVDKVLTYLIKEDYLIKKGNRYHILKKAEWNENLIETGSPIDFKMPYFYDIANFNWGDLLLIGSKHAKGKTHISMNIVKQLVEQGKTPYYISLETGSRFASIALQLGLKEGDFKWCFHSDPRQIELESNAITIIDWLLIENKAETDTYFKHFVDQLYKTQGILIVFQQLKSVGGQDNQWFAGNMTNQFPAFSARYLYSNEDSGEYGKFLIDKIRDPKINVKAYEIPCRYNWETKELIRIDELEKDKKDV